MHGWSLRNLKILSREETPGLSQETPGFCDVVVLAAVSIWLRVALGTCGNLGSSPHLIRGPDAQHDSESEQSV